MQPEIDLNKKRVIAFAGIGHPNKFFDSIKLLGAIPIKCISCPNHYHFNLTFIESLLSEAKDKNAALVTTEKDFIRLPNQIKENIIVIKIDVEFNCSETLELLFKEKLDL